MESNVKRILLIAFAALVVLLLPWWIFVVGPIWGERNNLVADPAYEEFRAKLAVLLKKRMVQAGESQPESRASPFRGRKRTLLHVGGSGAVQELGHGSSGCRAFLR